MSDLKPCPFCGGKPYLANVEIIGCSYVVCTDCRAQGNDMTKEDAIAAWNTRAAPVVTDAMVQDCIKKLLNDFNSADWYWRTMDPDDSSDVAAECIHRGYIGNFTVCEISSSFRGPTRYCFTAPTLDLESDDEELLHFETLQEAINAAKERRDAIDAHTDFEKIK